MVGQSQVEEVLHSTNIIIYVGHVIYSGRVWVYLAILRCFVIPAHQNTLLNNNLSLVCATSTAQWILAMAGSPCPNWKNKIMTDNHMSGPQLPTTHTNYPHYMGNAYFCPVFQLGAKMENAYWAQTGVTNRLNTLFWKYWAIWEKLSAAHEIFLSQGGLMILSTLNYCLLYGIRYYQDHIWNASFLKWGRTCTD